MNEPMKFAVKMDLGMGMPTMFDNRFRTFEGSQCFDDALYKD